MGDVRSARRADSAVCLHGPPLNGSLAHPLKRSRSLQATLATNITRVLLSIYPYLPWYYLNNRPRFMSCRHHRFKGRITAEKTAALHPRGVKVLPFLEYEYVGVDHG